MITVKGRYPSEATPLRPQNMTTELSSVDKSSALLRIDDTKNPDAWLEIWLEREDIIHILRQMDAAEEGDFHE
jgi:hypothetical protein